MATFMKIVATAGALLICAPAPGAELHPIVEVQSGYLFGATTDGKWIKSEEAAKALSDARTYQIYGLTQSLGEANGGNPKPSEEDVCSDVLTVSLSPKPEKGAIALAAPWNALPRKPQVIDPTQKVYSFDAPNAYKVIATLDLDDDGKLEVVVGSSYYEGEAITIYRCEPKKKAEALLSVSCGA
jgi:hypothetical protein